jgi:dolichol-phosphate mannosyltransferase
MKKKLTIFCPCYNEEKVLPIFIQKLELIINKITNIYDVNVVFTDNCSSDRSLEIIKEYSNSKGYVYYNLLSKNFGYQASLEITIKNMRGDLFIQIDVDGEDPPEMIPKFLEKYEEGYEIVYGKRINRHEGKFLKFTRKFYYRLLKIVSDDPIKLDMAEFSLFTDEVRKAIIQDKNTKPFIRSNISRVGYRITGIEYKREKRYAGESYYTNLFQMFVFGFSGILTSSTLFLRLPLYFFPIWLILSCFLFFMNLETESEIYLKYLIFIFLIYISFTFSFIGIYTARIYKNGLNRPNAFINEKKSKRQI